MDEDFTSPTMVESQLSLSSQDVQFLQSVENLDDDFFDACTQQTEDQQMSGDIIAQTPTMTASMDTTASSAQGLLHKWKERSWVNNYTAWEFDTATGEKAS